MDLPQGRVDDRVWREHAERVKTHTGSMASYCRAHNLDYNKFMRYQSKIVGSKSVAAGPAGFAKVQPTTVVAPITKLKSYPQLPDPKWLAELIHSLIRDR